MADVDAVVADLATISNQAQGQGFPEAVQAFAADVRAIAPTLAPPSRDAIETFADDLGDAVADDGPGGAEITPLEQATLTADFYAAVFTTGITTSELTTLEADLVAAVGTLTGISTDELRADVNALVADASVCLPS
jgi:hypothetical protein